MRLCGPGAADCPVAFECAVQRCRERAWVFHVEGVTAPPSVRGFEADDLAKALEDSALPEPESGIPRIEVRPDSPPRTHRTEQVLVLISDDSDFRDPVEGNVN